VSRPEAAVHEASALPPLTDEQVARVAALLSLTLTTAVAA